MTAQTHTVIGFIGQGWIGKHYADDFEARGYETIRYALEEPYLHNKDQLKTCDIIFIAVPTPTTPKGFDYSIVEKSLSLIPKGKTAIIKSTLLPGTTKKLQAKYPDIFVFHSPEFLVEKTAAHDAAHPLRNIVGVAVQSSESKEAAEAVLRALPYAPYQKVMDATDAELVKYAGNCFLFTKVLFMNVLYDLVTKQEGEWEDVKTAMVADPRIGSTHTEPELDGGRGAGGHCFIKDFEAFREQHKELVNDSRSNELLTALVEKNIELLVQSGKDLDLLEGVYGDISGFKK